MPIEWVWPAVTAILLLLLLWERISSAMERRRSWDRESELLERLHRKERTRLVAEGKAVEPEPEPEPVVGPPPNGREPEPVSMPTMDEETEAMIEEMNRKGLAPDEILRRLSQRS